MHCRSIVRILYLGYMEELMYVLWLILWSDVPYYELNDAFVLMGTQVYMVHYNYYEVVSISMYVTLWSIYALLYLPGFLF